MPCTAKQSGAVIEFATVLHWRSLKALLPGLLPLMVGIVITLYGRKFLQWDLLSTSSAFNIFILITHWCCLY
jgi:hypothetical protein